MKIVRDSLAREQSTGDGFATLSYPVGERGHSGAGVHRLWLGGSLPLEEVRRSAAHTKAGTAMRSPNAAIMSLHLAPLCHSKISIDLDSGRAVTAELERAGLSRILHERSKVERLFQRDNEQVSSPTEHRRAAYRTVPPCTHSWDSTQTVK